MDWIDWVILLLPVVVVLYIGYRTQHYVRGVADYLAGGRAAGRYLLTTAEMIAGMGLITAVANFEAQYKSGFAYTGPWGVLLMPLMLIITLSGYLIYRYRETRAMTLAQFFEMRYSRKFRVFCGILAAAVGILNYGIFPLVSATFFVHFCGLPLEVSVGGVAIPTFILTMFLALSTALVLVLFGGQLTILVVDSIQSMLGYVICLAITVAILMYFRTDEFVTLFRSAEPGESIVNPWDISKLQDFNIWFWIIGTFGGIYAIMAWQGNQGFNASAASPHEAKMGRILGTFRASVFATAMALIVVGAMVVMKSPEHASIAEAVNADLARIDNDALRGQMIVPLATGHYLPSGLRGAFAALMLFLMVTTDVSYLHSWGSIVVQDVVMPFRKRPMAPGQQIRWLRIGMCAVALYAFIFGCVYEPTTYILMFFALTGSIWLAGAGACIAGGLYWRRGTAAGAWGAVLVGASFSIAGFLLENLWGSHLFPWMSRNSPGALQAFRSAVEWVNGAIPHVNWVFSEQRFPINGQWIWAFAMALSISTYVVLSLLTCRQPMNMDKLLHRGAHAVDEHGRPAPKPPTSKFSFKLLTGVDDQMTGKDRRLTIFVFAYTMFWWVVGMVILVWNIVPAWRWPAEWWIKIWFILTVWVGLATAVVVAIWFTWGGIRDLRRLFRALADPDRPDAYDDGTVNETENAVDIPVKAAAELAASRVRDAHEH